MDRCPYPVVNTAFILDDRLPRTRAPNNAPQPSDEDAERHVRAPRYT